MATCRAAAAYRGPLIVIGLGIGFIAVGSIPFTVTFCRGIKNSATIIGVGFIGFGLLLVLPGLFWCLVRRVTTFRCCTKRKRLKSLETQEKTHSFQNIPSPVLVPISVDSKTSGSEEHLEHFAENDVEEVEIDERKYDDDRDKSLVLVKR